MISSLSGHCQVHASVPSRLVQNDRQIIVYTPPGYRDDFSTRYPVLYLQDGQNLFDSETAFCNQDWGLRGVCDDLISSGLITPLVIVGIYNSGDQRIEEYSPTKNREGIGGGARRYGRFLTEDLKPLIDSEYRTLPDAVNTGLGGSSMGGLASLYLGLHYRHVFGNLIIMSPSLWWANRAVLRIVRRMGEKSGQRIWLDVGTAEGSNPALVVRDARDLRNILVEHGWQLGQDLRFVEDEGAGHDEKAWARRMRDALCYLFPAPAHVHTQAFDAEAELHP